LSGLLTSDPAAWMISIEAVWWFDSSLAAVDDLRHGLELRLTVQVQDT
jgi:hypothetical protein